MHPEAVAQKYADLGRQDLILNELANETNVVAVVRERANIPDRALDKQSAVPPSDVVQVRLGR